MQYFVLQGCIAWLNISKIILYFLLHRRIARLNISKSMLCLLLYRRFAICLTLYFLLHRGIVTEYVIFLTVSSHCKVEHFEK